MRSNTNYTTDSTMKLITEIRRQVQAAKTRSKSGRCTFSEDQKARIISFCEDLMNMGFQEYDAAQILGMHVSTIKGWNAKKTVRQLKSYSVHIADIKA